MEKYIERENVRVYYDSNNENQEITIVLVHGFGVDRNMWQPQIAAFGEYHIICLDVRGHGKSRPCGRMTVLDACEDIKAILNQENRKAAVMVGLSMGSYIVQEFVRQYPEMTLGVLAADGTPIFMKYPKWETVVLKYSAPLFRLYRWDRLVKEMARVTSVKPLVREALVIMFNQLTQEEFIRSWTTFASVLHEEEVTITCPFFVAYGESDRSGTIKAHIKDWGKEYPGCRVFKIPDAAHVSNMDNPKEFNRILRVLLEEITR